jgi:hypothetical protein
MAKVGTFNPAQIIKDYRAAYRAANNEDGPEVVYQRGWFIFTDRAFTHRRRRVDMLDMTARLQDRASHRLLTSPAA